MTTTTGLTGLAGELRGLDATAQAELARRGQVTPAELVEAAIERIQALNPVLNAVVTPAFDRALDAELFKALSDPTRLKLLACLAKCSRMCSVTEVAECCSVDFSVVSRSSLASMLAEHIPPPMKPSPVWSKLSASSSSNAVYWPSVPL